MVMKQQGKGAKSPRQQQQSPKSKKAPAAPVANFDDEDDDDSEDDSDSDIGVSQQLPKVVMPAAAKGNKKKSPAAAVAKPVAKQPQQSMEVDEEDDEDDSGDSDDSDETPAVTKPVAKIQTPVAKQQAPVAKKQTPAAKAPVAKQQTPVAKKQTPVAMKPPVDEDDSEEDDEDEDDESEEEEGVAKQLVAKQEDDDDDEEDDDEDDEDDEDEDESDEEPKPVAKKQPPVAKAAMNGAAVVPVAKATHYVLLGNLEAQASAADLKNFLSRRGVAYVSAAVMDYPVAILGLSSQADSEAAMAKCQGADYKSRQLAACQLAGRPDRLLAARPLPGNTDSSKLFVSNLPAELDETSLVALAKEKLGARSGELVSARLLMKKGALAGAHRGQAIVELAGAAAAQTLLEGLSGHLLAGKPVKASYHVASAGAAAAVQSLPAKAKQQQQQQQAKPAHEGGGSGRQDLRGQTRTVLLLSLPADSCADEAAGVRTAFPGGARYTAKVKDGADSGVCFVEFDTEQACSEAFDQFGKVGKLDGRDVGVTFVPQRQQQQQHQRQQHGGGGDREAKPPSMTIGAFNLPFSATVEQLREHFDGAEDLFIPKDQDGRSRGFAIVKFGSIEAATKAISDNANLSLDGRSVRVEFREDRQQGEGGGRGGGRGGGGRGGFGGRGGGGRGGFGGRGGGRGGFEGRGGGRGGFGGRGGGRGGFGGRGGGGGFGDRGGKRQSFGSDGQGSMAKKQKFDSDSD